MMERLDSHFSPLMRTYKRVIYAMIPINAKIWKVIWRMNWKTTSISKRRYNKNIEIGGFFKSSDLKKWHEYYGRTFMET